MKVGHGRVGAGLVGRQGGIRTCFHNAKVTAEVVAVGVC